LTSSHPLEGAGLLQRSSGGTERLLNRFGGFLLLAISSIAHFTGATGVPRPENVDRADPIGVFLETARDAGLPGASLEPAADLDIFRTRKSSIHTIAWFWLIAVEVLCR
jgi:hypothetical protein